MQLRPYQENALRQVRHAYANGKRSVLVVSPTGSGKGVILSQLIRQANDKGAKVLFLVHRREILFQVSRYLDNQLIPHGVILAGEDYDYGNNVELATVQTISRRMKRIDYQPADVIVIDEAHHATADVYMDVVKTHQKNLVVGFTATPCRQNGLGLGHLFDHMVTVATIEELTRDGYLVPIRYYAPDEPDLSGVKIVGGDYSERQLEQVMAKPKLVGDVVENWVRLAEGRQTVVFTTTVAHSVMVCDAFNAVGIPAEHVDGKTDKDERAAVLDRFRNGDTRILCNCAVFTEGVDIPDISCVVMARPTKSLSLYLQCVGRGMRPAEDKADMILIDHAGACYEHGPVHEITEWTLDEKTRNTNKKNDERKEKEQRHITCDVCSRVYSGQIKCPDCGTIPEAKRMGKNVDFIDAELGLVCFKTNLAKVKARIEDKQRWYSELLGYARAKGFKPGWAYHKYRDLFGVAPSHQLQKRSENPGPEVLAWIRGQAARRAMAAKFQSQGGDACSIRH